MYRLYGYEVDSGPGGIYWEVYDRTIDDDVNAWIEAFGDVQSMIEFARAENAVLTIQFKKEDE